LLRNAQKSDKNKSSKATEGEKKKAEGKKATFFVMSPDARWAFVKKSFFVCLNPPCYAQKRDKKKSIKKKRSK
jgi:hypothetical protein